MSYVSKCSNLIIEKLIKNSQYSMRKNYHKKILLLGLVFIQLYSFSQTSGFTIPQAHPRLWWNTERLARAKTWYQTHSFTPANDDPFGCAFRYTLTGEKSYADKAVKWLIDKRLPAGQLLPDAIGCDDCRWSGEYANIVFDWCYNEMSDAQRNEIITRWNKYYSDVNKQDWGGIGMEGNNYYWGNLRNSVEWGIATFHHNTSAQSFLDHGLKTRWEDSFKPYATNSTAKGGALGEGSLYGCTMLDYPVIPFSSVNLLGRNIYEESNFYKEALVNIIYSTTPAPIIKGSDQYYDFFLTTNRM